MYVIVLGRFPTNRIVNFLCFIFKNVYFLNCISEHYHAWLFLHLHVFISV